MERVAFSKETILENISNSSNSDEKEKEETF